MNSLRVDVVETVRGLEITFIFPCWNVTENWENWRCWSNPVAVPKGWSAHWAMRPCSGRKICRVLRISSNLLYWGCFVATLHRNCRSLDWRVLSDHHNAPNTRTLRLCVLIACDNVVAKDYDSQAQRRARRYQAESQSTTSSTPNFFQYYTTTFCLLTNRARFSYEWIHCE